MKGRKIPRGAAIAMIVGGDIVLLLMGWFLLVSPQRSTAKSIARSVAATQVQIVEAQKPLTQKTAQAPPKQPEIRTAYLYKLSKAMPMTQDMPNLLLELSDVVRKSGVQLSSMSPGAPDPTTGSSSITLAVDGDFYSVTDMLYRLRTLVAVHNGALDVSGRLFSIKSVNLSPTGIGKQLNASVTLNTFTFGAQAAAAAAAAAAVPPASTDTTTTDTTSTDASASADVGVGH
jgi:Tfp pilus assembly protein PilO